MNALSVVPLLSLCIWVLPIAALIVAALPARHPSTSQKWGFAASLLSFAVVILVAWATVGSDRATFVESIPWIPSRGATYLLETDWTGLLLASAAGATMLVVYASGRMRSREGIGWMLATQGGAMGVFFARDVMLLLSFWGVVVVGAMMVVGSEGGVERRRVALRLGAVQLLGFFCVLAVFVECYQRSFLETGFASSDLLRWRHLVLYPDSETRLSMLSALGVLCTLPIFPFGSVWRLDAVPAAPRCAVLVVGGLAGNYVLVQLVIRLFPGGLASAGTLILAIGLLTLLAAVGSWLRHRLPRGAAAFASVAPLGVQGLVLIGWGLWSALGWNPLSSG